MYMFLMKICAASINSFIPPPPQKKNTPKNPTFWVGSFKFMLEDRHNETAQISTA